MTNQSKFNQSKFKPRFSTPVTVMLYLLSAPLMVAGFVLIILFLWTFAVPLGIIALIYVFTSGWGLR